MCPLARLRKAKMKGLFMIMCSLSSCSSARGQAGQLRECRRIATRYDKLAANYLDSSSLRPYAYGRALMSPRPSSRTA
jgi:hypothetical protein